MFNTNANHDHPPARCPFCSAIVEVDEDAPSADAPCTNCGHLLWMADGCIQAVLFPAPASFDETHGRAKVVIRLTHRLLGGEDTPDSLFDKLFRLGDVPVRRDLILDFRQVQFVASGALAKLITVNRILQKHHNRLCVAYLNPELRQIFRRTRLDELFLVASDADLQHSLR